MKNYFEGWYFKQSTCGKTFSFIPAIHADCNGVKSASLQVITNDFAEMIEYPSKDFRADRKYMVIGIGNNVFSRRGIKLDIDSNNLKAQGLLVFGKLTPPRHDIMGPFSVFPFLECHHSLFSLRHSVEGNLCINGEVTSFKNGTGYLEGDRGHSFPENYIWTQCSFGNSNSLMLSVAEIPFLRGFFTGIICSILLDGREYRLATYFGAHVKSLDNSSIAVKQGDYLFTAELLDKREQNLHAPVMGEMTRLIRECVSCRVRYRFSKEGKMLFDFISDEAGYEHEWY